MYHYSAFMLNIQSELLFPELVELSAPAQQNQITIQFGSVSREGLNTSEASTGYFFQAAKNNLWLHVPNIARFLVTNGDCITIDPVDGIDDDSLRVFVLGSCIGALLMQRGIFLLHGNAVKIGEYGVSFVGYSGSGKSTLSGGFLNRGYSILADDVCAITPDGQVIPSFPQIKLWSDAAKKLNIETGSLRKVRPCIEKFAVPLSQQFHDTAIPLKLVYVLKTHNQDDFQIKSLNGMQKLNPLQNNTYRKNFMKFLSNETEHMMQCAMLANKIGVIQITRPRHGFKLDQLMDVITHDIKSRGLSHAPC